MVVIYVIVDYYLESNFFNVIYLSFKIFYFRGFIDCIVFINEFNFILGIDNK